MVCLNKSFRIPEIIDENNNEAKLDKVVLTLNLPKKEIEKKEKKKVLYIFSNVNPQNRGLEQLELYKNEETIIRKP